jgi:ATP-dependent helicase/nuclease subunit A
MALPPVIADPLLDALDAQQRRAATDAALDILVSAGAGSGKTRVLTARYLHLLKQDATLTTDNILTLTFTRKAALEMRERIGKALGEDEDTPIAAFPPDERHWRDRARRELRKLSRAPIGTIHSFCERILREHALQAGIDPNARLLDDALARTLQEKVLDEVLETAWSDPRGRDLIGRLLLDVPQAELRGALLGTYRTARGQGVAPDAIVPLPPVATVGPLAALHDAVAAMLAVPGKGAWIGKVAAAKAVYEDTLRPLLASPPGDEDFWSWYFRVQAAVAELKPSYVTGEAKACRDAVDEAAKAWMRALMDGQAQPYLAALLELLRRFDDAYCDAKDQEGLLDYEDLLLRTRALLEDPASGVATRFRRRFKHVMVDEFQDTNRLQLAIVEGVRGEQGTLFTVGDVKQSIYRFIGSNVGVFLARQRALQEAGKTVLPLDMNYRSRPEVLQPLNALFAQRWPVTPAALPDGFTFEPLSSPDGNRFAAREIPCIEYAFFAEDGTPAEQMRRHEAAWIARRILALTGRTGPALQVLDQPEGEAAPRVVDADFSHVIVLFRSTSQITTYAEQLRLAGVPVYVVSGRGFFAAREVQDLIHMLRVLENPLDDFSLAVVLRSPLAAISDDALVALTWGMPNVEEERRDYGRLWLHLEQAETLPGLSDTDRAALLRFRDLVRDLHGAVAAGQPLEIIDAILDRTDYAACLLAGPDGEQSYANVQKLREVAADFQGWGLFNLTDFRRHLTQLQELAPREASAPLDAEKSASVRLMTIHAAKGLEAPVVFLADCGWRHTARAHGHFQYHPERGLACSVPDPEAQWQESAGAQAIKAEVAAEEEREAERLLYVALTRAKEYLICTGFQKKGAGSSYLEMLTTMLEAAGTPEADGIYRVPFGAYQHTLRRWTADALAETGSDAAPLPPTPWEAFPVQILAGAPLPVPAADVEPYQQVVARFAPLQVSAQAAPLRVGVNRALCYDTCPRQYWFRYLLFREGAGARNALPPVVEADGGERDDETLRTDGTAFGKLLHGVLQRADFTRPIADHLGEILTEIERVESSFIDDATRHDLSACLDRLQHLEVYRRLCAAPEVRRELQVLIREGNVLVPGIIDVLARDAGGWWVLDYKTGRPSAWHKRQVGLYALGVAQATGTPPAEVMVVYLDEPDPRHAVWTQRVDDALLDPLRMLLRQVGDGLRTGTFPPTPGQHCGRCPHRELCPEGAE